MPRGREDESGSRKFLSRTSSWGKIIIFFFFFFAGLCLLLLLYFFLNWQTTSNDVGLGILPQPDAGSGSTLIWYDRNRPETRKFWINQLDKWFYSIPAEESDVRMCSLGNGGTDTFSDNRNRRDNQTSSCYVDNRQFGPCNPENDFGYRLGEPCILIKLNQVYGWEPKGYGLNGRQYNPVQFEYNFDNDMKEIEKEIENNPEQGLKAMPESLRKYINWEVYNRNERSIQWKTDFLNSVFISCEGENPADKENIGPISYYPHPYLPSYYFPFTNQRGYQSPFVMVQLRRPMPGVLMMVECRAWAWNIKQNRPNLNGMAHFEILID